VHLETQIALAGRPLPALEYADNAVWANPRSAEAMALLGLALLNCGEWEKAESHLKEALSIDPRRPEAHLGLGEIAAGKMSYHDAISHLRQASRSERGTAGGQQTHGEYFRGSSVRTFYEQKQ
jgi:Tfp pilus assembly protein PilF